MAKRNQNSFLKRQKEIKRQQEAHEKMLRRQGKKKQAEESMDETGEETGIISEEQTVVEQDTPNTPEPVQTT